MGQEKIWDNKYKSAEWKKETIKLPKGITGKSVLEIGVGNGKTLRAILRENPKEVLAIDFSEEAIKKSKLNFQNVAKIEKKDLFEVDGKFDVIVCYYILNNMKKKDRINAIKKISGLLENKGKIFFEDFMVGDMRQKGEEIEDDTIKRDDGLICHFFTKNEIENMFNDIGNVTIKEREDTPIRKNKTLKRKVISAIISC